MARPEDTSTPWTISSTGGNFGYLAVSQPLGIDDDEDIDIATLGLNFVTKAKPMVDPDLTDALVEDDDEPVIGIKRATNVDPVDPVDTPVRDLMVIPDDQRTNEDIRAEALSQIVNALDLPEDVIERSRVALTERTAELRDYIMDHVVPTVLSIDPAMTSVVQMIPLLFENGTDLDIELPTNNVATFAQAMGTLATRLKVVEMLGLGADVRDRLLNRLVPMLPEKKV